MRTVHRLTNRPALAGLLSVVFVALACLCASAGWGRAAAQITLDSPPPRECDGHFSNATLAGCFGWSGTAFVNNTTTQAAAAVGLMHLDGSGNLNGWYSGDYVGSPVKKTYTGSYNVNPNGTGHMKFIDNVGSLLEYDFVIVKGGNEVLMTNTQPGIMQVIEMKRQ